MPKTVLILGSNGRFGRNAAEAFWNAGWAVRRFDRKSDDLLVSAQGADIIVNGWNPPSYEYWSNELLPLTEKVISAAKSAGATIIQPANVYVYGEGSPAELRASTPHQAKNPLGRLRIQMEATFEESGIQTILLRAGDYLDTQASGNWFDRVIAAKAAKGKFSYPGDLDTPHAWAWLPDLAKAAVALADRRDQLGQFEDILFPGYTLTGRELSAATEQAVGRKITPSRMSWLPIRIAKPFWAPAKHLLEMRYLWSMPHSIVDPRLHELVPDHSDTDLIKALGIALKHQVNPDKPVAGSTVSSIA